MSDMPSSETTLYTLQTQQTDVNISENTLQGNKDEEQELQPLPQTATQNYYGSSISTSSITPDQFEMIENDKNCGRYR